MQRRFVTFLAMAIVLCVPVAAQAVTTFIAGNHNLLPNTPGQVVQVLATGTDSLDGVNLNLVIGDGGAPFGGSDVGPVIAGVDAVGPGTIFNPNHNPQVDLQANGLLFQQTTFLKQNAAPAVTADGNGGILAFVTIDTTGIFGGSFPFRVSGFPAVDFPPSDWAGSVQPAWQDGSLNIQVVPEPSAIVLGLFAAAGMAAVVIRRRRSA